MTPLEHPGYIPSAAAKNSGRAWKPGRFKAHKPRKRLFHVDAKNDMTRKHGFTISMAGRAGHREVCRFLGPGFQPARSATLWNGWQVQT